MICAERYISSYCGVLLYDIRSLRHHIHCVIQFVCTLQVISTNISQADGIFQVAMVLSVELSLPAILGNATTPGWAWDALSLYACVSMYSIAVATHMMNCIELGPCHIMYVHSMYCLTYTHTWKAYQCNSGKHRRTWRTTHQFGIHSKFWHTFCLMWRYESLIFDVCAEVGLLLEHFAGGICRILRTSAGHCRVHWAFYLCPQTPALRIQELWVS